MSVCFGDTSYFLALLIAGDENHAAAQEWAARSRNPIVTTEFVVLEVANFLSPPATRGLLAGFLRALYSDARLTLLGASSEQLKQGCDLYLARKDKSWSLTDCISFEIMRQRGITDALTADRHFEQAGFNVLLSTRR